MRTRGSVSKGVWLFDALKWSTYKCCGFQTFPTTEQVEKKIIPGENANNQLCNLKYKQIPVNSTVVLCNDYDSRDLCDSFVKTIDSTEHCLLIVLKVCWSDAVLVCLGQTTTLEFLCVLLKTTSNKKLNLVIIFYTSNIFHYFQ